MDERAVEKRMAELARMWVEGRSPEDGLDDLTLEELHVEEEAVKRLLRDPSLMVRMAR